MIPNLGTIFVLLMLVIGGYFSLSILNFISQKAKM